MKRTILAVLCAFALLLPIVPLAADETGHPGLYRYKLENGLELYVYRDNSLPIARIEICFRAGAMAQTPDTAGLFHLYEHLVFGGDASNGGSAGVKAALATMGAAEWNGGTSAERVDYWLTLPSSKVAEGLRFWADRLRPADFSPADLDAAKSVVSAEVRAYEATPEALYQAAMDKRLFAKYPWRRDPAGTDAAIKAATPEAMAAIRDGWFIPNNAAVIVGGDVDPEAVRAAVASAFAGWKAGPDPWARPNPPHPRPGVVRPTWMVYPDTSLPEGVALVEMRYRAPDLGTDPRASYAADLWTALVADPAGRFKAAVMKGVPRLYGVDPISAYYVSQREGGTLSISAYFSVDSSLPAASRAQVFKETARGIEITTMRSSSSYFSAADYEAARERLAGARRLSLETASDFTSSLAWWWAEASGDYFIGYDSALAKTGPAEVNAFIDTYILRNLEVIALRMNPADYERERKSLSAAGFATVNQTNAYWWQK